MEQHHRTLLSRSELPGRFWGQSNDSSPGETPHSSMAEGPRSWKDFTPVTGAAASPRRAADGESTGWAQRPGLHGMDPA